ncbi:MAG TPA: hypothetical protein VGF56_10935 [Rhizomicrobium sp.]|jgi:hypothetical protein
MRTILAAVCVALGASAAQAAPGGDYVLFKAKVTAAEFVAPFAFPNDGEVLVIAEGGNYRVRLAVEDVLIGDVPQQSVVFVAPMPDWLVAGPNGVYVLARRTKSGGYESVETSPGSWGPCFDEDWKALGIAAEWRAQAALHPCTPRQ